MVSLLLDELCLLLGAHCFVAVDFGEGEVGEDTGLGQRLVFAPLALRFLLRALLLAPLLQSDVVLGGLEGVLPLIVGDDVLGGYGVVVDVPAAAQ